MTRDQLATLKQFLVTMAAATRAHAKAGLEEGSFTPKVVAESDSLADSLNETVALLEEKFGGPSNA